MGLLLNKLLPVLVLPLGITLALLAIGVWRKSRRWLLAGTAWLWLVSTPWFSDLLMAPLENAYPAIDAAGCPHADAIVVLSGMQHQAQRVVAERIEWSSAVDRFEEGLRLAQAGKAPLLIFTGGRVPWQERETTEGDDLRNLAIARGVAAERVLVVGSGLGNTQDEAKEIRKALAGRSLNRILLVTSAFHMARSVMLFQREGFHVIPYPADFRSHFESRKTVLYWLPTGEAVLHAEKAFREFYGLLWYGLFQRN